MQQLELKERAIVIILARDSSQVKAKIGEITKDFGLDYFIVCGEKNNEIPNLYYRKPIGKWDALNYSFGLIPENKDIIIYNDVDTEVFGLEYSLSHFLKDDFVQMVYGTEIVTEGPQSSWFKFMNRLRARIPIASSGELLIIRRSALKSILPVPPCMAEDTYVLFKLLETRNAKVDLEPKTYCVTTRTRNSKEEIRYKKRTVLGIYQALSYTRPPVIIRFFYAVLPFISVLLLANGKNGAAWMSGIIRGYAAHLANDTSSKW